MDRIGTLLVARQARMGAYPSPAGYRLTEAVNQWKVDRGARRRLAAVVEERLRVERQRPAQGVDPPQDHRQER